MGTNIAFSLCLIVTSINAFAKPVSYQVHSWNDMSLWPNGFKQGMIGMKIDAHYMEKQSFCLEQQQVTSNSSNGCFLLSHDSLSSSRQYNTTDDVIKFITNNINLFNSISSPRFLAICFKLDGIGACDNTAAAISWRSLVSTLMNELTSIITKYSLTISIILDGSGASTAQCLAHDWEPYIKTFVGKPSDPIASSNNITLDTSVSDNAAACTNSFNNWVKVGFEKFNNTQQPWLWWEPSSQECVRQLSDAYNVSSYTHSAGFYFAINIDIARFKLYSGYNTWNKPMKINISNLHQTQLTQVVASFIDVKDNVVIISFASVESEVLYSISTAAESVANGNDDITISKWQYLNKDNGLNGKILTSITGMSYQKQTELFCISSQDGFISLLTMDTGTYVVSNVITDSLIPSTCGTDSIRASSTYMQYNGNELIISQLFSCGTKFGVQIWSTADITQPFKPVGDPILIDFKANSIDDVSIVVSNDSKTGIAVWSSNKEIFGVLIDVNEKQSASTVIQIGVGDKPRLTINTDRIIMVHENAYCWISQHHLKASTPATCKAKPTSMQGVLAYTMGSINDWIDKFKSNISMISVCDEFLIHGMYDGGYGNYPTLFIDSNGKYGVITTHQGITTPNVNLNNCGAPIVHNDLLLDSWPIVYNN